MSQPHRTLFFALSHGYRTFVARGHTPLTPSRRAFAATPAGVAGTSKTRTTSGRSGERRQPCDGSATATSDVANQPKVGVCDGRRSRSCQQGIG